MARLDPTVLRIPVSFLRYRHHLEALIADTWSISGSVAYRLFEKFAFCNDEKPFVTKLLRHKPNFWVFRCNQRHFCGDFILIDMSSPDPKQRRVLLLDLKRGAPIREGGGGAGIQFRNAPQAISAIAQERGIIPSHTQPERLTGDGHQILAYLGIDPIKL